MTLKVADSAGRLIVGRVPVASACTQEATASFTQYRASVIGLASGREPYGFSVTRNPCGNVLADSVAGGVNGTDRT